MESWRSGMAAGAGGEGLPAGRCPRRNHGAQGKQKSQGWRTEGEEAALGSCSRQSLQRLFPVPKLGGAGWEITPWRLFSPGILPHPSSTGCSAAWGGREWVRESLSPQGLQEQLGPSFNGVC